ncbi:MAG: leucine-rich repeat domain-containing protein [Algibacter sp.]
MKVIKNLTLVLAIVLCGACSNDDNITSQPTLTIEDDRNALIEIYNANSNNTLTWDIETTDVSTWQGITVENNRVAVLSIGNKNISVFSITAMQKLTALRTLVANDNSITSIDVSNNANLKKLSLFNNQITTIDVSNNILLEQLLLENNSLEGLDVSMLSNLTDLKGGSNNFTNSVNIANGNNSNMWRMQLAGGSLSCVQVDSGATNGLVGWSISSSASYSLNCQQQI